MKYKIQSLDKLLEYKNEDVLSRFMHKYDVEVEEADDIFKETVKFLYLGRCARGVFINDDLKIIDLMWHNFILFTSVYADFCLKNFGQYVHHTPSSKREKEEWERLGRTNPELVKEEFMAKYRHLVEVTYDHLGEETVIKWFELYSVKYSEANIENLRVK